MGQINVEKNVSGIEGLCVITPAVHGDSRGYFMETYSQRDMEEAGIDITFVQDNLSMSIKGVLRGLHFQRMRPHEEGGQFSKCWWTEDRFLKPQGLSLIGPA